MNDFITTYQKDIALMFKDYGIDAPVTRATVLAAFEQKGKPFQEDFELLVSQKNAGFTGMKSAKVSGQQWGDIFGAVLGAGSQIAGSFGTPAPALVPVTPVVDTKDKDNDDNKNNYIMAAAAVLIVVLVVLAFNVSKK